jgi:hypothetical protein
LCITPCLCGAEKTGRNEKQPESEKQLASEKQPASRKQPASKEQLASEKQLRCEKLGCCHLLLSADNFQSVMAKNKKAHFIYHSVTPFSEERQEKHQHVTYSLPVSGKLKVSSTFVTTVGPILNDGLLRLLPSSSTNLMEDVCEEDIFDPAYLEHLEEMSTEFTEPTKQQPTATVSS